MAIPINDSQLPLNPKPVIDFERKLVGNNYIDYTDFDDVNNTVNINFRKNKYFWVASNLYHTPDGTTYNLVGGKDTTWDTTDNFFDVIN